MHLLTWPLRENLAGVSEHEEKARRVSAIGSRCLVRVFIVSLTMSECATDLEVEIHEVAIIETPGYLRITDRQPHET